jgi:hypothetical protein
VGILVIFSRFGGKKKSGNPSVNEENDSEFNDQQRPSEGVG